jgi:hypothetical protein
VADIREVRMELLRPVTGQPDRSVLGPALPDGSGILRILDPDSLLDAIAAGSCGLIAVGVTG